MASTSEFQGEGTELDISAFTFDHHFTESYTKIVRAKGHYLFTDEGGQIFRRRKIFDASSGAAVSCLGYGNKRVIKAMTKQLKSGVIYAPSSAWETDPVKNFCQELVRGTNGKMAQAYLTGSGSEAMEAAIKLSRQYFYEQNNNTARINFISRERSYHGNTIGALSLSDFKARQDPYMPLLMKNAHHISACYQYRQQNEGESDQDFITKKVLELEKKFQELNPDTVIGFIAEPVVGAALGCVPSPSGYLKAMKDVCHKYGALFILDEVMCGMGRTGTLHAWQVEEVVPDIQLMAKGLGGGYQPISAMLVNKKIVDVLGKGSQQFIHGLTYQAMPLGAVAGLEVQRIIQQKRLLENVSEQGTLLECELRDKLTSHPNVGDIRGRGLFWGVEFVKDKATKEPFDPKLKVAYELKNLSVKEFDMFFYPSMGCCDGISGDVVIIAPPYTVTKKEVKLIVHKLHIVVKTYFSRLLVG